MSENLPEHGLEAGEATADLSLVEPFQASTVPETPIPESPPSSSARITKPLPDPETPLPMLAKITKPLSDPETPLSMRVKITKPLPDLEAPPPIASVIASSEQDTLPDPTPSLAVISDLSAPEQTPVASNSAISDTNVFEQTEEATAPASPHIEETIELSPRARRVLLYLARRRMRNVRIIKREPAVSDVARQPTQPLVDTTLPALLAADVTALPPMEPLKSKPVLPVSPGRSGLQPYYPHSGSLSDIRRRRLQVLYRRQYFSRKHLRRARASDLRARRRLWATIWSTTTSFLLLFLVLAGVIGYIAYNFINTTQGTYASQVLTLRDLMPPDNLKIYDGQGNLIDQLTDQGIHTEVKYNQIAPVLVNATVAIEDRTFWSNQGVDITGILRAALADLENGQQIQGGSTITQQLIKKLIVGDSSDAIRKLSELVLAPQVNSHYSKRDIMEMYLNTIYYGHQAYGIDAAATVYFGLEDKNGKSAASQLDLAQAAMLAGLPRNASLYDPAANLQSALDRAYNVLEAMVGQGDISQVEAQLAYQEEQSPGFFKSSPALQDQAPHFDEYVLSQLEQMFHLKRSQLSRSGLVVSTTINVGLQKQIQKIMQQHIAEIRDAHHVTNAAEVLIDFHTGAIISMLGSIDYYNKSIDGQFNAALGYRQPGSSFKPYVYVTAFEQGASPAQAIDDAPTTFNNPGGTPPTYSPSNYDLHSHGHMTLRCALQNSLNVPAVRVLQHVGVNNALATAQAMGITSYEGTPGLSMVLGGLDVRLLDHTSAIGVFADGGVRLPYYSISRVVQGTTGKVLFQHKSTPGKQVVTPQLAYLMTNVLSDNTSRTPEFFDCNVLQLYSNSQQECYAGDRGTVRPAAAKTGTTQDFRDNWTVGYTTDYVMGVWAGNDDNSPMVNVTGVQGAAPIWHDAMLLAEQGHPIRDFQNPGGLERATVTYPDGVKTTDWFLPGTVPHNQPAPTPTPGQPPFPFPPTGNGQDNQPTPAPYCSTYSFAFPPPAGNGIPANGDWW